MPLPPADHRRNRRLGEGGADRAEQHAREAATAVASDDHQLSSLRFVDQPAGGCVAHNPSPHVYIWILFLPTRQPFAEHLLTLVFVLVPVHAQHGEDPNVAPRV